MAITIGELQEWIKDCGLTKDDFVCIGDGGLTLEAEGHDLEELYIEIGGRPEEEEE